MAINEKKYKTYINILKEELVPAMGCTEPIAIAYCGSILKYVLGKNPKELIIKVSGNIIKNVKSVIVPHTHGLHGIESAACIGIFAGDYKKGFEVLSSVSEAQINELSKFMNELNIKVEAVEVNQILYIELIGSIDGDTVRVIITDSHTHVYLVEKNGIELYKNIEEIKSNVENQDKTLLNIEDIVEFADRVNISEIQDVIKRQIDYS